MKSGPWSAKEEALLRRIYPTTPTPKVVTRLKRSLSSVKNRIASLRLRKETGRRFWKKADDNELRRLYPTTSTVAIARSMHRGVSAIYGRVNTLGLEKDAEFIRETGRRHAEHPNARAHRFQKGTVPPNKGVKHRRGYGPGRMKETQFKKGQDGWNWKPIGSERLVDGYRYTKINDTRNVPWTKNWYATHILRWEKKHRRRLDRATEALVFKNGDRRDVRLANLKLISRADNMRRNSVHNLPQPLRHAVQLLGALKGKITRRLKREEQNRRLAQPPVPGARARRRRQAGRTRTGDRAGTRRVRGRARDRRRGQS